jgi:hypothetical protein
MVVCAGVNDVNIFDGDTRAVRIAADLFRDDFSTCMDKGFTELNSEFKTYYDLNMAQGQVCASPWNETHYQGLRPMRLRRETTWT